MYPQQGGGGKGTRPQSTHQQNHNHQAQHHQTAHSHHHHLHQQQQQQQILQQQQQQQQAQAQAQVQAHHQPVIFYPQPSYAAHTPAVNNNASSNSLGHPISGGHHGGANGVAPGANLTRALSNPTLPPHFSQSAGLMAPTNLGGRQNMSVMGVHSNTPGEMQQNPSLNGGRQNLGVIGLHNNPLAHSHNVGHVGPGAGAPYITATYLPFNQTAQLMGMPSAVTFPPNNQQTGPGGATGAGQTPTITYYLGPTPQTTGGNNVVSGGNSHRGNIRGGQRTSTTPQHPNFFTTYAMPPGNAPRPAQATVTPMMNSRNGALNGAAAFHLQHNFMPGLALAPPAGMTPAPILAPAAMTAPPPQAPGGLHNFAPHLQSSSATTLPNVPSVTGVPAVAGFSTTSLPTPPVASSQQVVAKNDKANQRKYAIPIIHPDTYEDVMNPKSSVFNKKDSNSTLTPNMGLDSDSTMHSIYQGPILMDSASASSLLSGVMVDQEMQTAKTAASLSQSGSLEKEGGMVFGEDSVGQEIGPPPSPGPMDKDQISVIVKDILAHSGNTDEHLSFWQCSDVDNVTETHDRLQPVHTELKLPEAINAGHQPVLFQEQAKKQRPKSANKQSTATPTSIANDVAEAAASGSPGISILSRGQPMLTPSGPSTPPPASRVAQQKPTKSIATTAVPAPAKPTSGSPNRKSSVPATTSTTTSSGASSSAASTPTHASRQQQGKQIPGKLSTAALPATPRISAAVTLLAGNTNITNTTSSTKKQRKAQKRAKELEKKKQKSSITTTTSSQGQNNNGKGNGNGAPEINTNNNNAATVNTTSPTTLTSTARPATNQGTTTVDDKATAQPMTDKLSATSNNPNVSSTLRDNSMLNSKEQLTSNNNNNDDEGDVDAEADSDLESDSKEDSVSNIPVGKSEKHLANEEIVAKFLQTVSPNTSAASDTHQLQFLNSSSSVCEEDEPVPVGSKAVDRTDENADMEIKFGDFQDDARHDTGFICSSTWSSSTISKAAEDDSSQSSRSADNVDCAPKVHVPISLEKSAGSKETSPIHQSSGKGPGSPKASQQKVPKSKSPSPSPSPSPSLQVPKNYRYSIETLRELSKRSDSLKPPLVPCQKGDCISQLFVSRQQQPQQHHGHGHGQHIQQYQHMSFNESMDYVPGKRGRGHGPNKKHHDGHQQMGGSGGMGNVGGGGGINSNQRHMDIIRVQLSLKEEIKLSECENAWQPGTLRRTSMAGGQDEDDVEGVLKKVRGILNKLTPDNFEVLLKEMSSIKMDNEAKMTNVMLLIFEKTISEPNFAPTYARFCKVLFHEIKAENKSLFTSSLITRIQHEFESNVNDANAKAKKLQPTMERMNQCSDPARKAELRAEMEDLEYQFRRRAWGTVRFIGELFKLQSLTSDRVLNCVESLLEHGCEEKLEYMCKLLTTVGHLLEACQPEQYQLRDRNEKIFRRIQDIINRCRGTSHRGQIQIKISSRVRFMMQDVLDLRLRNWDQPSTHQSSGQQGGRGQRHKQHDDSKDQSHHSSGGGRSGGGMNQHQQSMHHQQQKHHQHGHDGGNYFMQKMPNKQHHENQTLSIDPSKLRFSSSSTSDDSLAKLGNSSHYQWRNSDNRPVNTSTVNTTNVAPPTSLLKRPGQNYRFSPYQQPSPPLASSVPTAGTNRSHTEHSADAGFDGKQCQELIELMVEEALNTRDWQSEVLTIWRSHSGPQQSKALHYLLMDYLHKTTVKRQHRQASGNVFAYLMEKEAVDKEIFGQAYSRFSDDFPDLLVDVPNGWGYVFEFLGPIIHSGKLDLKDVWQRRWLDDLIFTERFVYAFVSYFVQEFGAAYARKLWHNDYKLDRGQLFWNDVRKYKEFVQSHSFYFLDNGPGQGQGNAKAKTPTTPRSPVEHVERIRYLLALSCDMAIDYINTNVAINDNFVRQLTRFLCCDFALTVMTNTHNNKSGGNRRPQQLNTESFRSRCTPLLRLCIDAQEALEIACIDEAVDSLQQHFMTEFEDEMAAGETICSTFSVLYESEVIPKESFDKWYKLEIAHSSAYRRPFIDKLRGFIEEM